MNKTKNIICLICLVLGVFLQFCLTSFPNFGSIAGSLLILLVPHFLCSFDYHTSFDENSEQKKWKTIEPAHIQAFTQMLNAPPNRPKIGNIFLRFYNRCCLNTMVKLIFIIGMSLVWIIQIEEEEFDANVLNVIWDIFFIPNALLKLKYGDPDIAFSIADPTGVAPSLSKDKISNLQLIHTQISPFCTAEFQAELTHDSYTLVTDLRIQAKFSQKLPNLLCAMFSTSMNSVQERKYPFSYFVYVFKGTKIKKNHRLINSLKDLTIDTPFTLEIALGEDKQSTVFVVTKLSDPRPYYTDSNDCSVLCALFHNFYQTFLEHL